MTPNLISGHIASGVKQAGTCYRHLYGTREVIAVLRVSKHISYERIHKAMAADRTVVVMKLLKDNGAKGSACLGFKITDNRKRND